MADNPSTTTPPSPSPSPSSPSPSSSFFQSLQAHATRFGSSAHSTLTHVVTNGITHLQGGIGNTNTANKQHIHPPPSHHDPIPPVKDGGHSSSSTTTTSTRSSLTSLVNHISLSSAVNHLSSTVRTSTQDGLNSLGKLVLDTAHSARNSISGVMGGNGNAVKDTSPSSTTTKNVEVPYFFPKFNLSTPYIQVEEKEEEIEKVKDTNINELSNTSITTTIYSSTSTHTKYSFKKIKLFIDSDAFYLSSNGCEETLRIHFTDGSLSTVKEYSPNENTKLFFIYGILGLLQLSRPHLAVIGRRKRVVGNNSNNSGSNGIYGKTIYQIEKVALLPLNAVAAEVALNRMMTLEDEQAIMNPITTNSNAASAESSRQSSPKLDPTTSTSDDAATKITTAAGSTAVNEELFDADNIPHLQLGNDPTTDTISTINENEDLATPPTLPTDNTSLLSSVSTSSTSATTANTSSSFLTTTNTAAPTTTTTTAAKLFGAASNAIKEASKNVKHMTNHHNQPPPTPDTLLDDRVVRDLISIFDTRTFYYSLDYDLSNTLQRKAEQSGAVAAVSPDARSNHGVPGGNGEEEEAEGQQQVEVMDKRFFWNESLAKKFAEKNLIQWIVPCMQGFVQIETCQVEEVEFEFAIIARRSRERAGLRYERRGVDEEGHAANFVENEMILIFRDLDGKQHHTSFIQTRGSIPFFWSQVPTTLKPVPNIDGNDQENEGALLAHFAKQQQQYQNIIAVNLVEQTGREAIIGQRFKQLMEKVSLPNVKYLDFDFHAQTKGMHYEKLNGLLNLLDNLGLSRHFKYFWSSDTEIICRQGGVVRTNCMDCLDRTNVVQSILARQVVKVVLIRLGCEDLAESGDFPPLFEQTFKNCWANNGDSLSQAYTGTRALKSDFTRTGKRNILGIANDAASSINRAYKNNFVDGVQQAAIDVFLGIKAYDAIREIDRSEQIP